MKSLVLLSVICIAIQPAAAPAQDSGTVNVQIGNQIDSQSGVNGRLQLPMSTSFQLAPWSYQFFTQVPNAATPLGAMYPWHTRVQVISTGIPLTAPDTWDFTELNAMFAPVQNTADHSPEFQIGTAPAFMSDSNGYILPASFPDFAKMSANLVRYYNTGGFTDSGNFFQSPTPYQVTWWGIFNEPNGNGLTSQQYVDLYNAMVPAMAQADPSIKFLAVELSDYGNQAETYLPAFVSGVTAPVDVLATHFYSSCDQTDLDAQVFATVPGFVGEVQDIYSQLATNPSLAGVPVWVTENNVNADYNLGNGMSACNPGQTFVTDLRGTSPFFAAWRSLVFASLGETGVQALYHWSFGTDQQYGEVDASANPYLSYWVDYYLSHWLPSPPGQDILQVTASGCCQWTYNGNSMGLDTHTLAARNVDGSVVILMSNHAVAADTDNNGPGAARNFTLDLSALGTFSSAMLLQLDAATPLTGPVPVQMPPSAQMQVTLEGYGAALLRLSNASPALTAGGVANAASYAPGAVAPGEIVSLFGSAVGPPTPAPLALTNPLLVANSLEGVHVLFDGVPAPVLFASAGQINVVIPYAVAGESATQVQVEYLGSLSAPISLPVAATAPGIFTLNASGTGPGAILNAADESVNSEANPAAPGDWVSIFATGAGATTPAGVDGLLATGPSYPPNAQVTVSIGGLPCQLNYEGAAPGLVSGVVQINAQVPAGLAPSSSIPVQLTIGTASSQSGVTLAVR
ncbi:MAG TPA: hypothetical protein VN924_12835 [Bryobacteraceae bacterium]|nr:hypothetical protein [Bryobacteraceae bacterium]